MTAKEFITNWFAYIDAKKFDAIANMMHSKHTFVNPMTPEPGNKDMHLGMIQMMTGAFDGAHTLHHIVDQGEWVSATGTWSGTHTGEFNGIKATGNKVEFTFLDLMHVVNGKVTDEYFTMDAEGMMKQIM
jgi:predicted ester cyclase